MAEAIVETKPCPKCGMTKSLAEFSKRGARRKSHCKPCIKVSRKRYNESAAGREHNKQYWQSASGKQSKRRWYLACCRTDAIKARSAISVAVRMGKMPPAKNLACRCGQPAQEYHHHLGYAKEHWLDVLPLCATCHHNAG